MWMCLTVLRRYWDDKWIFVRNSACTATIIVFQYKNKQGAIYELEQVAKNDSDGRYIGITYIIYVKVIRDERSSSFQGKLKTN
jgi:hypothetical protein